MYSLIENVLKVLVVAMHFKEEILIILVYR